MQRHSSDPFQEPTEIRRGQTATPEANAVVAYDFRRPDPIPAELLAEIRAAWQRFLSGLSETLSIYLRAPLASTVGGIEPERGAALQEGFAPEGTFALDLAPFSGEAVLGLSPALLFAMLEILLGAKGAGAGAIEREFTEIEQHLLSQVLDLMAGELRRAWAPIAAVEFRLRRAAADLDQLLDAESSWVLCSAEAQFGESSGNLLLAVPSLALRSMAERGRGGLDAGHEPAAGAGRAEMFERLRRAHLGLEARLVGPRIRLQDLLGLRAGQVLSLEQPVETSLDALMSGKSIYKGKPVTAGDKLGFRIEASTEEPT